MVPYCTLHPFLPNWDSVLRRGIILHLASDARKCKRLMLTIGDGMGGGEVVGCLSEYPSKSDLYSTVDIIEWFSYMQ
jgi:hypothetical protein